MILLYEYICRHFILDVQNVLNHFGNKYHSAEKEKQNIWNSFLLGSYNSDFDLILGVLENNFIIREKFSFLKLKSIIWYKNINW